MSYDPDHSPQPHAITGAAACLLVSDIPFKRAVAGVRVALLDGEYIVNPAAAEMEQSSLEVVIAGTESAILMIEGFADFVSEEIMLEALEVGHKAIAEICAQMSVCAHLTLAIHLGLLLVWHKIPCCLCQLSLLLTPIAACLPWVC